MKNTMLEMTRYAALARQAVAEGVVLLKNEAVLPLAPGGIAGLHLSIQPIAAVTAQYLRQIRHMGHIDQSAGSGSAFIVVKLCVPKQGRPAAGSQR